LALKRCVVSIAVFLYDFLLNFIIFIGCLVFLVIPTVGLM